MLSAWMPLDDAKVENGCMWMVPGSHTWGDVEPYTDGIGGTRGIPHRPPAGTKGTVEDIGVFDPEYQVLPDADLRDVRAVPREVLRGECHFHHGLMWHASPNNSSPNGRRGYAVHFMPASTRAFAKQSTVAQQRWKIQDPNCCAVCSCSCLRVYVFCLTDGFGCDDRLLQSRQSSVQAVRA